MTDQHGRIRSLGDWKVMSLNEGFHAHDASSNLVWPLKRSPLGVIYREPWREGWNAPSNENGLLRFFKRRRRPFGSEREYRRAYFKWLLSSGQAEAIGYLVPREENDRPVLIPEAAWESGMLDWDTASLRGAGFEFAHVRILMPSGSVLLKNGLYFLAPIPPLARFAPSEEERLRKDIPISVEAPGAQDEAPKPPGRPSARAPIIEAFEAIEKNPAWTHKELANAIRKHLSEEMGVRIERGFETKTIMNHVRDLWAEFKGQNPQN